MLKFINILTNKGCIVTKKEHYLEVLKTFDRAVTILEWAKKVVELHPENLQQINSKTNETMTLKELVSGLSLKVSEGVFDNVVVDNCKPYRRVQYVSETVKNTLMSRARAKDIELILLESKIKQDIQKSTESDRYRLEEFSNIVKQLNRYFKLDFQLHHTHSLLRDSKLGKHHVGNLEVLTEAHGKLKKDAQKRFSIEEQKAYIKRIIAIHLMIRTDIELDLRDEVLDMLLERLTKVY